MGKRVIHYAGEIRARRLHVLPGWAACCSGIKAEEIRAERRNTYMRGAVTCRRCLAVIAKHDEYNAKPEGGDDGE